jgi:hypothetical protein
VPVGYVDAYFLFEKHPRITAACDVVMTNCYPFWEGCPREQALPYMQTMLARTRAAAPGKRVLISETGWPDQGSAFQGSVPSHEGAMQYFVDTAAGPREGIEWFHFAAFDEAWKVGAEGDVGAFWGLWDKDGQPKFGLTGRHSPEGPAHEATLTLPQGNAICYSGYRDGPEPGPQALSVRSSRSARTCTCLAATGNCCACTTAARMPSVCCR